MAIPIFIINFNRLLTTRALVTDLILMGYNKEQIYILDNESNYAPLLTWYDTHPCRIIYLKGNHGNMSLYTQPAQEIAKHHEWVAYTDSDIELSPYTPESFLERMVEIAKTFNHTKVGLALEIQDLPDTEYANFSRSIEQRFWTKEIAPSIYEADVDSTFCVLNPNIPFQYTALRVGGEFTARHLPWYTDFKNLTPEELNYLESSRQISTYKRFYFTSQKN